jgi:transcriptional regulator with XRE-family HTH domain
MTNNSLETMKKNRRFSELLKFYRTRKGLSNTKLGSKVGVDPSYLSRIEAGNRHPPKRDLVLKLGDALGLTTDEKDDFLFYANYAPIYPEDLIENYPDLKIIEVHPTLKLLSEIIEDNDSDKNDLELIESVLINIKKRNNMKK